MQEMIRKALENTIKVKYKESEVKLKIKKRLNKLKLNVLKNQSVTSILDQALKHPDEIKTEESEGPTSDLKPKKNKKNSEKLFF